MSLLLYIDTSGKTVTVALSDEGQPVAVRTHDDAREQAALLNGMIETVIQVSGTSQEQVAAICVCAGPGSYTGLRVGLSTAKGLAYALEKPLMLFNNLDLLALKYREEGALDLVLKAREGEYFFGRYDKEGNQLSAPQHIFREELAKYDHDNALLITDDPALSPEGKRTWHIEPVLSLEHWIPAAELRFSEGQFDDLAYSEPFYLKAAYTIQSKK